MRFRDRFSHRDPAVVMGEMLLSPFAFRDSAQDQDFVDILPCRIDEVTLPMLGAAFFERGRLAPCFLDIHPSDTVALGDIGYVTEAGEFVVVDNVHHSLQAKSGTLSLKGHLRFRSCGKELEDTSGEMIVSWSGKSYQRRRQVHFPVSSDLSNQISYLDFSLPLSPPRWRSLCT